MIFVGNTKGRSFTVPLTSCLSAKYTNPNQSNRRSMVQWYFPLMYSLIFLSTRHYVECFMLSVLAHIDMPCPFKMPVLFQAVASAASPWRFPDLGPFRGQGDKVGPLQLEAAAEQDVATVGNGQNREIHKTSHYLLSQGGTLTTKRLPKSPSLPGDKAPTPKLCR
jgi:hypothetical protein